MFFVRYGTQLRCKRTRSWVWLSLFFGFRYDTSEESLFCGSTTPSGFPCGFDGSPLLVLRCSSSNPCDLGPIDRTYLSPFLQTTRLLLRWTWLGIENVKSRCKSHLVVTIHLCRTLTCIIRSVGTYTDIQYIGSVRTSIDKCAAFTRTMIICYDRLALVASSQ